MIDNQRPEENIYIFRQNLSEDILSLQRTFLLAEQTLQSLKIQATALTSEKVCKMSDKVFADGSSSLTHYEVQRILLLLTDKIEAINASFNYGELGKLKNETIVHQENWF